MNDITIFFSVLKIIFRLLNKFICFALTNIFNLMNFRLTNFTNKLIFKKLKKQRVVSVLRLLSWKELNYF